MKMDGFNPPFQTLSLYVYDGYSRPLVDEETPVVFSL